MSAKSALQVCIKVRPCEQGQTTLWQVKDRRAIQLIDSQADPFVFDYVFDQESNNQIVFDCMAKHIVEACMKGFNGTIFAYGQTSSGKTYTMMGDEANPGVMVLAAKEIFKQIARHNDRDFLLRVGYIEIYNEKIYDLLNKKNQDLKIHESNGMVHVNCEECIITSEEDLLQFLCMGNKERTVAETQMNERSSRSHAIFRIIIESRKTDRNDDDAVIQSLLNLVDLAGSERADQTGARGARLKEGGHINKSLHFLSNVIKSLAENEENKYVNFRDSKLTRILQASLGGNAFTSIICSIKPSIMEESQSTLNFAMRAKKIRLKPQLNEIVSDATMMKRLEREIKELKDRLAEEQRRNESQIKVHLLEQRIKMDSLKIITSNTIADKRNKNRRRTWCPATSNPEPAHIDEAHALNSNGSGGSNGQHKHSGLPKPSFYPSTSYMKHQPFNAPKTVNIMKSLEITEEEFKPAVDYNFGDVPDAMLTSRILPPLTLTPRVAQTGDQGCETLQAEVDALGKSKQTADTKIEAYEEELKLLKQTIERLEMENRSAVGLEFQFETHKTKSKLRENELLSVLSEKEDAIVNLEKTLKQLSKDVLRNSKEDQMRSMCPELETSCERICDKCIDLERLLQEYKKESPNGDAAQSIDCKCEQLRSEIANTRAQLESVQNAYKQMTSDMAEKSELYDRLSRDVISAEEAKGLLQEKCDDLENAQQRHDQIIQSMQAEYDAIQEKYKKLQQDYETLERTSAATEDQHKKLQSQNVSLQQEISTLKESFEQIQQTLMQTTNSDSNEKATMVERLKAHNEELMEKLAQLEAKYGEMQREYEVLSIQLIESMQDGDSLRDQCSALQEELQQQQVATKSAEENEQRTQQLLAHIARLESEVAEKNTLIDATESTINEMREQMTNLESALLEKSVIVNKVEDYQRQIESLEKQHAEMTMVCEELQEKVKENTINESLLMSNSTQTLMSDDSVPQQEIDALKTRLSDLNAELNGLQAQIHQKDDFIEKIQSELQELNERCMSMDVLQVELRANARQNQQLLDRQASKLTDDANRIDKLQESNAQLLERSIKAEEMVEIFKQRLASAVEVECSKEQYEKRLNDLQIAFDNAKKEFELKEMQNKDHLDNVKLEYLQKMEISETEYRSNMRKYNIEWEESKDRYETTLEKLQKQLSSSEERCNKLCADNESELLSVKSANEQLVKEKHELESLYDESQKLVQQIQAKLNNQQKDEEKDHEMITSSNQKFQELHEKYEMQMQEYEELKSKHQLGLDCLKQEKSSLQFAVDESKLTIKRLTNDLQAEQQKWQQQASLVQQLGAELEANAAEKTEYLGKVETLNNKIEDLAVKLKQATLRAVDFDKLVDDHRQIKLLLSEANDLNKNLAQKVENLESELLQAQTELTTQRATTQQLQSELETTLRLKSSACSEQSSLTEKLKEVEATILEQAHQFEQNLNELQGSKNELQLKLDSLLSQKVELEETNHKLTVKLKNVLNLQNLLEKEREHNAQLQKSNAELQSKIEDKETTSESLSAALQQQKVASAQLEDRLAAATTEANRNADELRTQIKTLQQEVDRLCSVVKTNKANFLVERIRLDGTISSLLEDKRNLEEKLCTTNEILKKVETDLRNSNNSFESNASNTSPLARKSLDRDPNQPRKSLSLESEVRRNRRISTHDERRRQSYWNDTRHVSCMTDPVDDNCNCAELDRKLQDCQRELFIRESMVTALNFELKNHPLKEETAILKRRIQEEQAKARDEIKRLKQKNIDLMNKVQAYSASAAITASAQCTVSAKQTTVETQTDSDLETIIRKTNEKYNDSLQLCRYRYNKIRELERELNENNNNISSQTAGQIIALKSQLESQKKEIRTLTNKYEFAKRALKMRRDENNELRQIAGTDVPASSK
ncbi:uncharacterized protein [Drosophila virilis]|uniref:Uncharacterized protein, isoform B n=1 Tax=Drosophila virilis TaxID=7244 RepID=A0A0Q9W9M1_DROVI|nr:kinesin-like protein KIN-7I isoform X2 [Drosophila virilis]KRF81094.1 uncharacterized protein Dvir_GJ13256, isoform B [Drosophila virilis]